MDGRTNSDSVPADLNGGDAFPIIVGWYNSRRTEECKPLPSVFFGGFESMLSIT